MKYQYLTQFTPATVEEINASLNQEFINIKRSDYVKTTSTGILALDGYNLAGYIIFTPRKTCQYIQWLVTIPQYRNRGIAKTLIKQAKRYNNCMTLFVEPETKAESIYLAADFKRSGRFKELPDELGNPRRMYHMRWSS